MGTEDAMSFTESEKAMIREHARQLGVSEQEAMHRMAVALAKAVPERAREGLAGQDVEKTH